jgi:serine protease AprX
MADRQVPKHRPKKTGKTPKARKQPPKPALDRNAPRAKEKPAATSVVPGAPEEAQTMTQQIAGFPYWEIRFDETGQQQDAGAVNAFLQEFPGHNLTDLFLFAHGWNNDETTARGLFTRFFQELSAVHRQLGSSGFPRRRESIIGVVGIIWPSMRWADEEQPAADEGGAASLPGAARPAVLSDAELVRALKSVYSNAAQRAALDDLAQLLTTRPRDGKELARFQSVMAQVASSQDAARAQEDNGEKALLTDPPQEVFMRFAALAPRPSAGGEAGLLDPFERLWDGAKEALRQATFWEMKKRAGTVGQSGLGPLIAQTRQLQPILRVHLQGHSFGARLVSFALAGLPADLKGPKSPVKSVLLLQGAFSHFAFADSLPHDPSRSGALAKMWQRVDGPLGVTHSTKDTALGTFYPLGSLAARQDDAAFEDVMFRWGAMGHDGAQAVHPQNVVLGPRGQDYSFATAGEFVNLDSNDVIARGGPPSGAHSDIVHEEIAWALLAMAGIAGSASGAAAPPEDAGGIATVTEGADAVPADTYESPERHRKEATLFRAGPVSEAFALKNKAERARFGLKQTDAEPGPVMVELNLMHEHGLVGAEKGFKELFRTVTRRPVASLQPIANTYFHCFLSVSEVCHLVRQDQAQELKKRAIFRIWPDFPVDTQIDRSVATVKADASRRSYDASGSDIVWAVVDSGIHKPHPHFQTYDTLGGDVAGLHWDFTFPGDPGSDQNGIDSACTDPLGHGSHVGGIIGGSLRGGPTPPPDSRFWVAQNVAVDPLSPLDQPQLRSCDAERLMGVAPRCKLVSMRVLGKGQNYSSNVIRALQHIREKINGNGKLLRIHGVNLSLGYEFNARWFACGQSPICVEVNRLARSGVVVVVAAGNTGYGALKAQQRDTNTCLSLTINDPGNAELAITVGATHRDSPHTYGVSYFSSKGPTGDGRYKPDLVAPGERITSCAAGRRLETIVSLLGQSPPPNPAAYIDESGTSMAASHVSGAIAAFLSIRREFIGQPERVKDIFLNTATSLGRERYFEGKGLVDLMRAIQAV